ncbi:hypothetical protein BOTCAL_0404g00020 [Botryotinia calthae]|uniref:Uncharacterized protein n=1 Tax=Botryotinia calthae TaxID=38488 RepID=A0A4Y8CQ59_9HELO|nr:hypothetical protein BOTCAL_0404g00020 [Botryotinia calthae]
MGYQAIVRFAALGQLLYRTEKVEDEAIPLGIGKFALAQYIGEEFVERDLASGPFMASRTDLKDLNPNIS